jgi:hypothetical protein
MEKLEIMRQATVICTESLAGVNKGLYAFELMVENCGITDLKILYGCLKNQLKTELKVIERMESHEESAHPLQYCVVEFLQNILTEIEKKMPDDKLDDIGYYLLKAR